MYITVFGSTDLTLIILNFLYSNSYKIAAVITNPEFFKITYEPKGVKNSRFVDLISWTEQRNIPIINYSNADNVIQELQRLSINMNFAVIAGWYHMVPKKLRDLFHFGCGGFHASLLPKLRGGAPLNWALLKGMNETGISFFELSNGVDDGLLYDQEKFIINEDDDIRDLINKSHSATLAILKRTLPKIVAKKIILYPQKGIPSYCGQRTPKDSLIDWQDSASNILALIKASARPYLGAYTFLDNQKITIWKAKESTLEIFGVPGQILVIDGSPYIACRNGESLSVNETDEMELFLKSNHKRMHNENC